MLNNKEKISKTAKEIFDNFEVQPSPEVWTNIEHTIHKLYVAKHHRTLQFVTVTCIILVATVITLYYSQTEEQTIISTNTTATTNTNKQFDTYTVSTCKTQYNNNTVDETIHTNTTSKHHMSIATNNSYTQKESQLLNTSILADNICNTPETNNDVYNEESYDNYPDKNIPNDLSDSNTLTNTEKHIEKNKDTTIYNNIAKNKDTESNNSAIQNNDNTKVIAEQDMKGVIYVPTAFTPDKFENNRFFVKGRNIKDYEIRIMSKSKVLVYSSTDINEQWDGTHNGEALEMGIYIYMIVFTDFNNEVHHKNGTLTLIRQK